MAATSNAIAPDRELDLSLKPCAVWGHTEYSVNHADERLVAIGPGLHQPLAKLAELDRNRATKAKPFLWIGHTRVCGGLVVQGDMWTV